MADEISESTDSKIVDENTLHDKCKHVVTFHNNLKSFFVNLKGVLPEYLTQLRACIKYYKTTLRSSYLEEVNMLMSPHIRYISEYDEGIFTDDYSTGKMFLLPHMDFRVIWQLLESGDFADDLELQTKTKKTIFNYLQTIYMSVQMAMDQINLFDKNMAKQKAFLINMMENLQLDDKVKARMAEMMKDDQDDTGFDKLGDIFGKDNFVCELAKEVAEGLDTDADMDNPVSAITSLFADNGRKLKDMLVKVGDKIEEKVRSGEITRDKLREDVEQMKSKLEKVVGKIPNIDESEIMTKLKTMCTEDADDVNEPTIEPKKKSKKRK